MTLTVSITIGLLSLIAVAIITVFTVHMMIIAIILKISY